jgi:hypothetical protein
MKENKKKNAINNNFLCLVDNVYAIINIINIEIYNIIASSIFTPTTKQNVDTIQNV